MRTVNERRTDDCAIMDISCYTDMCPDQEGPELPIVYTMNGEESLLLRGDEGAWSSWAIDGGGANENDKFHNYMR